jgi:hypothetical protein
MAVATATTEADGEVGGVAGGVGDEAVLGGAPPHAASSSERTIGPM